MPRRPKTAIDANRFDDSTLEVLFERRWGRAQGRTIPRYVNQPGGETAFIPSIVPQVPGAVAVTVGF